MGVIHFAEPFSEKDCFHVWNRGVVSYTEHLNHPIFEVDAAQDMLVVKITAIQTWKEAVLHPFHRIDLLGEQESCHARV